MMFHSDEIALKALKQSDNMLVPWYLLASYAYYILDEPVISDALFDTICRALDDLWDEVEHMHKPWIDRADLAAGTRLRTDYPSMVKGSACSLAKVPYGASLGLLSAVEICRYEIDRLTGVLPCLLTR